MSDEIEALKAMQTWSNPMLPPVFPAREPEMQFPPQLGPTVVDLLNDAIARKWREAGMKVPPNPFPSVPQPSTTPPMWAQDPTRSRRPRRNRNQPTRQVIA
ncbi:hypothetical protein [Rhodococcus sp. IEGM 1330]|uniref:hypothetical protein n=1 Tax=Rhodococcus sp. IEGM 1330 TaxID=3082225 RepID=UPI002952AD35|nr:hypothetical protein [Rhodococcus sp. IEGM 1330]MDV8022289.1 hypothetical protein [Rhodococcus sp. IEGM 1330]